MIQNNFVIGKDLESLRPSDTLKWVVLIGVGPRVKDQTPFESYGSAQPLQLGIGCLLALPAQDRAIQINSTTREKTLLLSAAGDI